VRAGFNFSQKGLLFNQDGLNYDSTLKFRSAQLLYDFFPWGGRLHVSPGLLIYNGNRIAAKVSTGGNTFFLNGVEYWSLPGNPVRGTAEFTIHPIAPLFLIGFGNLAPRRRRHLTFSIDGGMAYQGSPGVKLALSGAAAPTGFPYADVSDPATQSNLRGEEVRLSNAMSTYRFYPVVSVGLGYRF
jgi:hypothetical protein